MEYSVTNECCQKKKEVASTQQTTCSKLVHLRHNCHQSPRTSSSYSFQVKVYLAFRFNIAEVPQYFIEHVLGKGYVFQVKTLQ